MRTMSTRCLRVCIPAAPGFHHETRVEEPTEHTCLCVVTKLCVHLTSPQCVFGGIEASAHGVMMQQYCMSARAPALALLHPATVRSRDSCHRR